MKSSTARALALGFAASAGSSERHSATWRRGDRVIGVVRTGAVRRSPSAAAAARRSRVQAACPARQRASSQAAHSRRGGPAGSRSPTPPAGAPKPSSCAMIGLERLRALHARLGRDVLPAEQEAQEVARRDRLDLRAQPLDRVAMDARQQAALAPFVLGRAGREAAAHGEAFGLQGREAGGDRRDRAARRAPPSSPAPDLRAGRAGSRPAPRRSTRACR